MALALVAVGVAGVALALVQLGGQNVIPWKHYYSVRAAVPTADNLDPYADVTEAGVDIGMVTGITRGPGPFSTLHLRLAQQYGPIYRDATLLIRSKSVAEEKYVQLDPGHPTAGAIPQNGLLPASHALTPVEFDDVMSILNSQRRLQLDRFLAGLGPGLNGGANLNRTLESSANLVGDASPLTQVLAQDRAQVASLIDSFDSVSSALGARADAIRTLTVAAKTTAEAVAARDQRLGATLDALPSFLRQSRITSGRLINFSRLATPVMGELAVAAQELTPAVRDLGPAASEGQHTVTELDAFARAALPTVSRLRPFSRAGQGLVPPLAAILRQLNPLISYLSRYSLDINRFFGIFSGVTEHTDQVGHVARPLIPISRSYLAGIVPASVQKLLQKYSGQLDVRGFNPYPAPDTAADPSQFKGSYPRLYPDPPYIRR
jgi:phospholipid/cholesterol/gamma-HCH transport system substrate-binding protein